MVKVLNVEDRGKVGYQRVMRGHIQDVMGRNGQRGTEWKEGGDSPADQQPKNWQPLAPYLPSIYTSQAGPCTKSSERALQVCLKELEVLLEAKMRRLRFEQLPEVQSSGSRETVLIWSSWLHPSLSGGRTVEEQ